MRSFQLRQVSAAVIASFLLTACATHAVSEGGRESGSSKTALQLISGMKKDVESISAAAEATRPERPPAYGDVADMIENADMAAFMTESRIMYVKGEKAAGWGFAALDMLAANDSSRALEVLNAMPASHVAGEAMTAAYLKPWALAANGQGDKAVAAMKAIRDAIPEHVHRGHRALLLEGMGRREAALSVYDEGPDIFDKPGEDEEVTSESFARTLAYGAERILALRHAELLIRMDRRPEAMGIYTALLAADENDGYALARMEELTKGKSAKPGLTVKTALATALNDQANLVEERQALVEAMLTRGAEAPFNHFVSAMRQSALLLAPDNAGIRDVEAGHLYDHGFFEAAARLALLGRTDEAAPEQADLLLTAADAFLELGRLEDMDVQLDLALKLGQEEHVPLAAADIFVRSDNAERAVALIDALLEAGDLDDDVAAYAYMIKSGAYQQSGDLALSIDAARKAAEITGDDGARMFLASVLVTQAETRAEGLGIYRKLFVASPENPGIMNNFGYALVADPKSRDELDEGYRLLKKANRATPFEPNLLDSLGWAYYQYGDYKKAEKLIVLALKKYEPFHHWELQAHLGDVYWRQGREEDARAAWRAALDARPPQHKKTELLSNIDKGLTTPAPVKRIPPLVPTDKPAETSDI